MYRTLLKYIVPFVVAMIIDFSNILFYSVCIWLAWPAIAELFFPSMPEHFRNLTLIQVTWIVILVTMIRNVLLGR